mmetsp:Transcript_19703/g.58617  ORF Transcript_19703/g.58617 Transcript_19703/m.58617 type:complete len:238 (-) Transcript_19703:150-863(-)
MGRRKKKPKNDYAIFFCSKKKINDDSALTAVVALHRYCARFKLGTPGYREYGSAEHGSASSVSVVMDGREYGAARHADRGAAMERASLLTLNLLDPEGKSIAANVPWHNDAELKSLTLKITNATNVAQQPLAPLAMPTASGLPVLQPAGALAPPFFAPAPPPAYAPLLDAVHAALPPPPPAPCSSGRPAPLLPAYPRGRVLDDGSQLVYADEETSPEELRESSTRARGAPGQNRPFD